MRASRTLMSWSLWGWIGALLAGGAFAVMSFAPPDFDVARLFFTIAALTLAAKYLHWSLAGQPVRRRTLPFRVGAMVGLAAILGLYVASLLYVAKRERVFAASLGQRVPMTISALQHVQPTPAIPAPATAPQVRKVDSRRTAAAPPKRSPTLTNEQIRTLTEKVVVRLRAAQATHSTIHGSILSAHDNWELMTRLSEQERSRFTNEFRTYLLPDAQFALSALLDRLGMKASDFDQSRAFIFEGSVAGPRPLDDAADILEELARKLPR